MMDYFPLIEGLVPEYRTRASSETLSRRSEVVSAAAEGKTTRAHCRRTRLPSGNATGLAAGPDARGVFLGKDLEFPLAPEPGP
jgi:hypothetical protein